METYVKILLIVGLFSLGFGIVNTDNITSYFIYQDEYYSICDQTINQNQKDICLDVLSNNRGCSSPETAVFCAVVDMQKQSWENVQKLCSTIPDETTKIICEAKALAHINLEYAKQECDKVSDIPSREFCYADVTSKIDFQEALKECEKISEQEVLHACKVFIYRSKIKDDELANQECLKMDEEQLKSHIAKSFYESFC